MKLAQKLNRTWICCICAALIASLSFLTAPAKAAQVSSEFDFSAKEDEDILWQIADSMFE